MYIPEYFKPDPEAVIDLLRNFGAADLVTGTPDGLRATMLPMVYVNGGKGADGAPARLLGHVARKNDHWRQPVLGEAMAIVRGPDAYISPAWYETKRAHGRVVPTWNYITAHVYGELIVHDDVDWLRTNVTALTSKYESERLEPWAVTDAPPQYVTGQLRAIVGLELVIGRIEAKFKLSQNRSEDDVLGVIEGLASEGREDMSGAVRTAASNRRR